MEPCFFPQMAFSFSSWIIVALTSFQGERFLRRKQQQNSSTTPRKLGCGWLGVQSFAVVNEPQWILLMMEKPTAVFQAPATILESPPNFCGRGKNRDVLFLCQENSLSRGRSRLHHHPCSKYMRKHKLRQQNTALESKNMREISYLLVLLNAKS